MRLQTPIWSVVGLGRNGSDRRSAHRSASPGAKQPLVAEGPHALCDEYSRTIAPTRALVAEALTLERTLSDLVKQAYALTSAEIAVMWQTAPLRAPIPQPRILGNERPPSLRSAVRPRMSLYQSRHYRRRRCW